MRLGSAITLQLEGAYFVYGASADPPFCDLFDYLFSRTSIRVVLCYLGEDPSELYDICCMSLF